MQPAQLGDSRSSQPIKLSPKPSVKDIQQPTVEKDRGASTEKISGASLKASETDHKSLPVTVGSKASQQANSARAVTASNPLQPKPVDNSAGPNKLFSENLKIKTAPTPTEPAATVATARDLTKIYHVGAGDVLDIRLADQRTDRSTLFTISAGGLLDYAVLEKPLTIDGLTTDEIAAQLKTELKRRALSEADVSVAVRDYSSHTVIISGLVKEPGTKVIRREAIPLYVVLADAQVSPEANQAGVISYGSGESKTVDLLDPKATELLIRPGDVITVRASPKEFFYIGGDLKLPGEKSFHAGLTLTQAILAAGGTTRKAKDVEIGRDSGNGILTFTRFRLAEIKASQIVDPLVQPGDRITVME
jgi:protein involved in polysaccharide export with SLBB domain